MNRSAPPTSLLVLAVLLSACGEALPTTTPDPVSTEPSAQPTATLDPALGINARSAFIEAMCPVFLDILELDPRLAALRAAGTAEPNIVVPAVEIEAVADELRTVLNSLEAVPDWSPGQSLRVGLIQALHAIRVAALGVADNPTGPDAAERLAGVPHIASESLDRAMSQAADAGLNCDGFE